MRRALTGSRPPAFAQNVRRDTLRDPFLGLLRRVPSQVRAARRGLDVGVAEQFGDHGEGLAECEGAVGVGMAQVVDPDHPRARRPEREDHEDDP